MSRPCASSSPAAPGEFPAKWGNASWLTGLVWQKPSQWITFWRMQTVAELPEFIRIADKLLSPEERQDLIRYLALHPKAGDLMEGTGGVRKSCAGAGVTMARVAECVPSTTSIANRCRSTC